jgi:hypothetical protein
MRGDMARKFAQNASLHGRHSGAMRSIEAGISKFPDAQMRI